MAETSNVLLAEAFGVPLLAYLCATDQNSIEGWLHGNTPVPSLTEAVMNKYLIPLAQDAALERAEHPGIPFRIALDGLGQVLPAHETSLGNALRAAAGGSIPPALLGTASDDDAVKSALFSMAIDSYPLLLVPRTDSWFSRRLPLFSHPKQPALEEALAADGLLSALHPDDDPGLGRRGSVFSSLGRGGGLQSVSFGETLIASAWDAASIRELVPSPSDLLREVDRSVDLIRAALTSQPSDVRVLMVFTGLVTEDGAAIHTPWGDLRPLSEVERSAAPPSLEGTIAGTGADGINVTVKYEGELVLETVLEYRLATGDWVLGTGEPWFPKVDDRRSLRRRLEGVQLAALLALDRPPGSWPTVRFAWQWTQDPLTPGRHITWGDPRNPAFMPHALTRAECDSVSRWTKLIDEHWTTHVDVAIRRVLSAAHARTDPADRLVDAVITWENLFGTREGEARFRITSAMAWLLTEDPASRTLLQKQLKKLYDDRSMVVHGGSLTDAGALPTQANEALVRAIDCLRVMFGSRPDLLRLPDGAARSAKLILGG